MNKYLKGVITQRNRSYKHSEHKQKSDREHVTVQQLQSKKGNVFTICKDK